MNRLRANFRLLIGLLLLVVAVWSCGILPPLIPTNQSVHLRLGNPSHALSLDPQRSKLLLRPQYALLYDRATHQAKWASWQLNGDWLGHLERPPFTPDPELPANWDPVTPSDYTNSGFDRGHLVPAADRNKTPADAAAVFYMTNILPQAPDNNRGPWEALESDCRDWVRTGKELYIVAGPLGTGGMGSQGNAQAMIAHGKIVVPAALWKIVVVLDHPGGGLGEITAQTRVIAVSIPNRQGIKTQNWKSFRTTVRQLEQQTGFDFLANLPQSLQNTLETRVDTQ